MIPFAPPTFTERYKKHLAVAGLVAITLLIAILAYEYSGDSPYRLRTLDAKAKLMGGSIRTVVDVREQAEWWAGHYPGAIHIPVGDLLLESAGALPNKAEPILVYCQTGRRARHATEVLRSLGYTNVWYIAEPYWKLV